MLDESKVSKINKALTEQEAFRSCALESEHPVLWINAICRRVKKLSVESRTEIQLRNEIAHCGIGSFHRNSISTISRGSKEILTETGHLSGTRLTFFLNLFCTMKIP